MDDEETGKSKAPLLIILAACCAPELFIGVFGFLVFIMAMWVGFGGGSLSPGEASATTPGSTATTSCGQTETTLVPGFNILPSTSVAGVEQHLWLTSDQSAAAHYAESDTPAVDQNGMAGGYGGLNSGPPTINNERWYSNTQWLWWMNPDGTLNPCQDQKCQEAMQKTPHARIIITNVKNGKSVVTSAEESGPAHSVTVQDDGRDWGVSPEVWEALGGFNTPTDNMDITAGFAVDQSIPLGPCK